MSVACLSRAAATATATAFGNFAGPDRVRAGLVVASGFERTAFATGAFEPDAVVFVALRALAGDALVFAMQVVYRSVQMVREDVPCDRRRHEVIDSIVRREAGADLR